MTKRLIAYAAFAGSVAVAATPVVAQLLDEEGGLRQRVRVEQEFGTGNNLGLENPSEGRTSLATTRLSYGLESKTCLQELSFAIGGALRFGDIAEGNNMQTGFTDPFVGLRYFRDTGNATLSVNGDYRQSDISLIAPLWTFLDQDGIVRPPRDFSDIRGSGERESYFINMDLETGKLAPFGLRFLAGASGTNYIDPTDTTLTDFENTDLGLSALLRFNAVTTGYIDLRYSTYSRENATNTDRETQTLQAGFDRNLSPRALLSFRVGYTDVDTTNTDLLTGQRVTTQQAGPSGSLGHFLEMPNGVLNSTFDLIQNQNGQRGTLRFARSIDLPTGGLSGSIGLSSFDSSDPQFIGGINWFRDFPAGRINFGLNRDFYVDSNDEDRFTNTLIAGYQHEINSVSNLSADLSLFYSESTAFSDASQRGSFVLAYNHQLTQDWSLNTGVELNFFEDDASGMAKSDAIFFGIGRNFDISN